MFYRLLYHLKNVSTSTEEAPKTFFNPFMTEADII